jgi:hypothetical protein
MTASTITFYKVETDVERFQYFLLEDASQASYLVANGAPWKEAWMSPSVFSFQPRLREGDFWHRGGFGACFAVRPEAFETGLDLFLQPAGELLPLPYQGRKFKVLNVTECIDALDHEQTTWYDVDHVDDDGFDHGPREVFKPAPRVEEPVFRLDRLGWQLFKVPETAVTNIYCWEGSLDGEEEQFRRFCEREGLTGLTFTEIYTTECPW